MDCNKDEAIRAKENAEKKLIEKDIVGAKKFASKAQILFPELEGISRFQDILDVYTAAERKVNGLVDWYEVLGVDPLADDETIRKKYRKLALALHPDKNKAVGADGAFKILSEAWCLLSDKFKKAAYDQKRNIKASLNEVSSQNPAEGVEKNARYNVTNSSSTAKNYSAPSNPQADSTPSRSYINTFWTSCNRCMMGYEYIAIYQNQNLLCPNCRQPFLATDIPPPALRQHQKDQMQQSGHPANNTSSDSGRKFIPTPKVETSGFPNVYLSGVNIPPYSSLNYGGSRCYSTGACVPPTTARDATQSVHSFQSTGDHLKRGREEAFGSMINVECVGEKSNAFRNTDGIPTFTKDTTQPVGDYLKKGHEGAFGGMINVESVGKKSSAFKNTHGLPTYNGPIFSKGEKPAKRTYNGPIFSKGEKPAKKRRGDNQNVTLGRKDHLNQIPPAGTTSRSNNNSGNQMGRLETGKLNIRGANSSRSSRALSQSENCNMLMEMSLRIIKNFLQKSNAANNTLSSGEADEEMQKGLPTSVSALEKSVVTGKMNARNMNTSNKGEHISFLPERSLLSSVATSSESKPTKATSVSVCISDEQKESSHSALPVGSSTKANEVVTMSVPDPEFYNFDEDRMEKVFAGNQVWAVYDDEDGMPRYYAIIHAVISKKPFQVRFSWLNSGNNSELGPMEWIRCGFRKTCGEFRIGKHMSSENLKSFSHPVKWAKGSRGAICIFPKKGDVWALYRNWSSDWNALTPDDVVQKYDMVEVVGDYSEQQGVDVVPLVKVAGFRSVFHQHEDLSKGYTIPREAMFRFSHQVPSYIITGHESEIAPKGCRELDTAAMPLELLQVIREARVAEGTKTATMTSGGSNNVVTKKILVYTRKSKGKSVVGGSSGEKELTM